MKKPLYRSGIIPICFLLFCSEAHGQAWPKMDIKILTRPNYITNFPWGGVDQGSYVYWPTTPPDMKPLQLVKAGKREEAFQYCMSKIDTTKGDTRFFYSIQAASMGFGLFKSHLVVAKLEPFVKGLLNPKDPMNPNLVLSLKSELLAMHFAARLAVHSTGRIETDPRVKPILDIANGTKKTILWHLGPDEVRKMQFSKLEHIAVYSTIAFLDPNDDYEKVVPMWSRVVQKYPQRADFRLMLKKFSSRFYGDKTYSKAEWDAPERHAEAALKIDPEYDRAISSVAWAVSSSDPVRSEALIRKYLRLGTGPVPEIESARALLDWLEKVNKKK